jgi:hypothetical protein
MRKEALMHTLANSHTSQNRLRLVAAAVIAVFIAVGIMMLPGCSSTKYHQVIDVNQDCTSCHSDGRTSVDSTSETPESVSTTITVTTSEDTVYVCKPLYVRDSDVKYVPREYSSVKVTDGKAEVTLKEGTWVIATMDDDTNTKSVLVTASADGSTTELSL